MVRLNRIYTRTGDDGTTGLAGGARISKQSARIEAIGRVDEANCAIGLAAAALSGGEVLFALRRVQNDLFDLGADLATPSADGKFSSEDGDLRIVPGQVEWIEQAIDRWNEKLAPLQSFVLPGGNEAAARTHLARAATRAAERAMVALGASEPVNPLGLAYVNRLSDLLFVLARCLNDNGASDITWVPGASRDQG